MSKDEIRNWIFTEEFQSHIAGIDKNLPDVDRKKVKKLLLKMSNLGDVIEDKDTGILNLRVLEIAFYIAFIELYNSYEKFEKSGM